MFSKMKASRLADEERSKALAKVMGEPIGFDISEPALKVKNLLLGVSIVLLCMVVGGVSVGKTVSFLGISLEGITANKMVSGLLVAVGWVTVHYFWYSIESFREWRLRITGLRVAYSIGPATFGSGEEESPASPKQSTLYNWWKERSGALVSVEEIIKNIDLELQQIQKKVDDAIKESLATTGHLNLVILETLRSSVDNLNVTVKNQAEFMKSSRIEDSLYRFDSCFWRLIASQNLRVLFVDISLPLFLGVASFVSGLLYLHSNV
ncbi:hypothetical protein [Pseudomonas sp. NPDC088444]|uniref:hypothetical protein n=1 Tax=Pseudomonas sp. NPDC088444 TaxID=3364456 RepID=UPI00384AC54C